MTLRELEINKSLFGGDEFWVISLNFLFPSSKSCGSHGWAFVWMSFGSLFPSHDFLFWSDELWKLKIHLGVFSFQNSVFNDIFVIRPTYPAATFEVENWVWVKVRNRGFGKLRYFKWWVMKIEWWQITNQTGPNYPIIKYLNFKVLCF